MKKFVVYGSLLFLCVLFSCTNTVVEVKGVSILGQYQVVSSNSCHIELKKCDNIKLVIIRNQVPMNPGSPLTCVIAGIFLFKKINRILP